MKSLKIKVVCGGAPTLQNPLAKPGTDGRTSTYIIVDIPDEVPSSEVVRMFSGTTVWPEKFFFRFSELGLGHIITIKTIGTAAAAKALGVARRRVNALISNKDLPAKMDEDGRWVIAQDDLEMVRYRSPGKKPSYSKGIDEQMVARCDRKETDNADHI